MGRKLLFSIALLALLIACKPSTPSQYIQPDEMESLLYDYHIARAMAQHHGDFTELDYRRSLYWQAALQKHHVTEAQFDSSLVYYYTRADRFANMYKHVLSRLQDEALLLGASEGEIGRYTDLNTSGDTANIWNRNSTHMLMPVYPYNTYSFEIATDSLFRSGDEFLLQFMSDFVFQSGMKDGLVYLAIEYPDTVLVRQNRFSFSGLNQIRVSSRIEDRPQRVRGYLYLGGSMEPTTVLRLLFLNNIQLIRFHTKDEEPPANKEDSLSSADAPGRTAADSDGNSDPIRTRGEVLSTGKRRASNRMVERIDSLKSRH